MRTLASILSLTFVLSLLQTQCLAQPTNFQSRGPGGGGALFLPSFNPGVPGELAISCDMSQSFRTTDYGRSWSQTPFRELQTFNTRGQIQFTSNPLIQYSIDVTNLDGSDSYRPTKSTDGGRTWTPMSSDPTSAGAFYLFASYTQPDLLVLADYTTVYCSRDGAKTWKVIYRTANPAGIHVAGALFFDSEIFVGLSTGILYSSDDANTFAYRKDVVGLDTTTQAIFSLSGSQTIGIRTTTTLYAAVHAAGDVYGGVSALDRPAFQGIYTTTMDAKQWQKKVSGIAAGHELYFVGCEAENESLCYAAGGSSNSVPVVYKSTNGGNSWVEVFKSTNNENVSTGWSGQGGDRQWSYGEVALGFAVNRSNGNELVMTDFGFAHISTDGGAHWKQAYVSTASENPEGSATPKAKSYKSIGLENTTCWHVVWLDSLNMFSCYSDIQGVRSTDGGDSWGFNYSGHSDNSMYYVVKHPQSAVVYGATSTVHDMYQSTYLQDARIDGGRGKVLFSTNNGAVWQLMHDFAHPVIWLALDPTNSKRMYASVIHSTQGGVFVCNDITTGAASVWTRLAAPPRTEGHPFNLRVLNDGSLVASYSGRRTSSGSFSASSGVFLWNGTSWSDRSDANMQYWTKDIVIDPSDAAQNTWYCAVFSGWGGAPNGKGGLYRTTNRGQNWTRISRLDRVSSLSFDPLDNKKAYMTTETEGLWFFNDLSQSDPTAVQVEAYTFRQPERVFFNPYKPQDVWVSSFGNGMKTSAQAPQQPLDAPQLLSPAHASSVSSTTVAMLWQNAWTALMYRVEISRDSLFRTLDFVQITTVKSITQQFNALDTGFYFWRVRGYTASDSSAWSSVWKFRLPHSLAATTLVSPVCDESKAALPLSLSWTKVKDAQMYRVVISEEMILKNPVLDSTINASFETMSVQNLAGLRSYYWCVYSIATGALSAASDTCRFTTEESTTDVEDQHFGTMVFPQPAREYCRISLPTSFAYPCRLRLHAVLGSCVSSQRVDDPNSTITLDLRSLTPGMYALQFEGSDGKTVFVPLSVAP